MAKGIKRAIRRVSKQIGQEIAEFAKGGDFARGLSGESYSGGYRDALSDVELLLNGVVPNRRDWWNWMYEEEQS